MLEHEWLIAYAYAESTPRALPGEHQMNRSFTAIILVVLLSLLWRSQDYLTSSSAEPGNRKVTAKDMPRIPPTPPDKALSTFQLAREFKLELVAAEPMVSDPVDACFDEFGRMYVAEMHGYPFSQEPTRLNPKGGGKKDAGIIRLLEDTNGDGRMDKSTVFADKISWPTSVCCYNGGVFVLAPKYLYYFKDINGDNKADVREVVLSGFGRDNVQSVANELQWGLDNRITFAAGRNPKRLLHRGKPLFPVGGRDLSFDPKTEQFELATGGLQFGQAMDDWGTRFVCSNSNHAQQVIYPQHYLARNPYFATSGLIRSIAADGASAPVYRISPPEPWRIIRQKWRAEAKGYKLVVNKKGEWEFLPLNPSKKKGAIPTEYPVGYFTSATGITIYRGDAYPKAYRGNLFVGDVGGNLVHRKVLTTDSIVYRANRADPKTEILRSRDTWFRPVNFVNAPDGTLYVLDMYRETIEHPYSIPAEIKKFLDLTSGHDRGRIYRLVSPGMKRRRPVVLGKLKSEQLVEHLGSSNGWARLTAQRLLWERQDKSIVKKLEKMCSGASAQGRMHALCLLQGLGELKPKHVLAGLKDRHPRMRSHAIRLSEPFLNKSSDLVTALLPLCDDESEHVRFQLAFTLGETTNKNAVEGLAKLASDSRNGPEIQTAILSSIGHTADRVAASLLQEERFLKQARARTLLSRLGQIAGANSDTSPSLRLLSSATSAQVPLTIQQAILTGLGQGLNRRGSSLRELLKSRTAPQAVQKQVETLFQRASELAADKKGTPQQRDLAIGLLAYADLETASRALLPFLSPQVPPGLQLKAVEALAEQESNDVAKKLLTNWRTYSPQVRRAVVDALMTTPARTKVLLSAVELKSVQPGDIERNKKQLLMRHPNAQVRALSRKLLDSEVSTNRAKVVKEYQNVLTLDGNVNRGMTVFRTKCAICHRVGDVGHQVAPDLSSVQNKSSADLLLAILDPNREAQPNFNVYVVKTKRGKTYSGIIQSETVSSITLLQAEGKRNVILRSTVEELNSTGASLMPEGFEKDLKRQDLADVIAFIKSIKGKGSSGSNRE